MGAKRDSALPVLMRAGPVEAPPAGGSMPHPNLMCASSHAFTKGSSRMRMKPSWACERKRKVANTGCAQETNVSDTQFVIALKHQGRRGSITMQWEFASTCRGFGTGN